MRLSPAKWFRAYDGLLLLAAAAGVLVYVAASGGWGFPLDDSWIHQTYGRNLGERGEWAFISGTPSAASTAPFYTVLLAAGYALRIPYGIWTHLLGVLALAATGMLGARLAERLAPEQRWAGISAGLAAVLSWHLLWAAASGMETMLFGAFTLALIALGWRELDAPPATMLLPVILRGVFFGVLAALTTLTRPEGILLAGIIGLAMLIARPQGSWRAVVGWGSGAAAGFLLLISPYLIINLQITGGLLPNTSAAKQAEYAPLLLQSYPERLLDLLLPLLPGALVVLLPGIVRVAVQQVRQWRAPRTLLLAIPTLWAVALIGLYAARLPAAYQHGRYIMPALPALIVIGTAGTLQLLTTGRASLLGRVLTRSLALCALLLTLWFAVLTGPGVYARDVRIINEEMVAAAQWINAHLDNPDALLALHDIGAVGYFASRPIVDLAGLVTPEVIPLFHQPDALWQFLRERNAQYLLAFPDQIPGQNPDDPRLCPLFTTEGTASLQAGGGNMTVYALAWDGNCPP